MTLADKIIRQRRKLGWSQEELAERMDVSRQAVSKWESAQSAPDLDRILALSRLFGVTTDYLLKDEIEEEEVADEAPEPARCIALAQASEYLEWRKIAAGRIAAATLLCVVGVLPLLILGAASEVPAYGLSEGLACGIGLTVLFTLVAAAVGMFISCGMRNEPFDFIDKQPFAIEPGVRELAGKEREAYRERYRKWNVLGVCVCVLSPVPLFIGAATEREFFTAAMTALTMLLGGCGAAMLIACGVRWASMQKLLQEGEYAPKEKRKERIKEKVAAIYWLLTTAVYLGWSFAGKPDAGSGQSPWKTTWIVWPVAGVLFAGVMCLCNWLLDRED